MKSTRERILQELLNNPNSSINDLANAVGINAISVRHHLTSLQADGLVAAQEERHGVGRPRLVYFLTEEGLERFPTRYLQLTNRLIEQMKATFPTEMVMNLFNQIARDLAVEHMRDMDGLPFEQKLDSLKDFMRDEGFSFTWENRDGKYLVHQLSCPFIHVTENHPEVCAIGQTLISTLLSVPTERTDCVLNGDAHCTFTLVNTGSEQLS